MPWPVAVPAGPPWVAAAPMSVEIGSRPSRSLQSASTNTIVGGVPRYWCPPECADCSGLRARRGRIDDLMGIEEGECLGRWWCLQARLGSSRVPGSVGSLRRVNRISCTAAA